MPKRAMTKDESELTTFMSRCGDFCRDKLDALRKMPLDTDAQAAAYGKSKTRWAGLSQMFSASVRQAMRGEGLNHAAQILLNDEKVIDGANHPLPKWLTGESTAMNPADERALIQQDFRAASDAGLRSVIAAANLSEQTKEDARIELRFRAQVERGHQEFLSGKDNPPMNSTTIAAPVDPGEDAPIEERREWAKATAGQEWDGKDPRRAGFSTRDRYVAFRSQELLGNVRVTGNPAAGLRKPVNATKSASGPGMTQVGRSVFTTTAEDYQQWKERQAAKQTAGAK